ncbi:MAG TPA: hypothetical protein VEQ10_19255, partial [Vicinamibacteria bacterium]|nr:hypothetical protein [Vicinamibacteria bacterium]
HRTVVAGVLAYSLVGVFTGIGRGVLIVYPAVFLCFGWQHRLHHRRWFAAAAALALLLAATGSVALFLETGPITVDSPLYVYSTFTSGDAAVATRGREVANFVANLERRHSVLQGIGLGNKWFEYLEQPPDLGAFPRQEWGSRWHLGVHVPFLRLVLDFGLVGGGLVLAAFAVSFVSSTRMLRSRSVDGASRAFVLASWAVVGYQLSVNNLSGPKTNLIAGVLLGAVAGILHQSGEQA